MDKAQLESLCELYPKGTKIKLLSVKGWKVLRPGLLGEVQFVDSSGRLHMEWENGSLLTLIPGEDDFSIVREQEMGMEPELKM